MNRLLPEEHHILVTALSPEQCRERLEQIVGSPRSALRQLFDPSDRPLLGTVSANGFSVWKADPRGNSFRPVAFGRFLSGNGGTRVPVRLGYDPSGPAFMKLWYGGLTVWLVAANLFSLATHQWSPWVVVVPLLMGAAGLTVPYFYRNVSEDEGQFVLRQLHSNLDAREEA